MSTPTFRSTVCALSSGDYHFGLAALVNSLYRNGYRGDVWVGLRGPLPSWAQAATRRGGQAVLSVADGCTIRFLDLSFAGRIALAKPSFMLEVLERHCPDADAVFYIDADIVVKCAWSFFEGWVREGVGIGQDMWEPDMSGSHPIRAAWRQLASRLDLPCRDMHNYFNAGFVAVPVQHRELLTVWARLIEAAPNLGIPFDDHQPRPPRPYPYLHTDQDLFNLAVMATNVPLSVVGIQAQFGGGAYLLSHAHGGGWGATKPWRNNYLLSAARGRPPIGSDHVFWRHADGPIRPYSRARLRWTWLQIRLAQVIGRFYSRPQEPM